MKFGVHLRLLSKPDWKSFYVNYEELKRIVKWGAVDGDGNESDASNEGSSLRPAGAKRRRAEGEATDSETPEAAVCAFLEAVAAEVKRAEDFYVAQQAECLAQLERATEVVARAAAVAASPSEHAAPGPAPDASDSAGAPPTAAGAAAATPALEEAISAAQAAVGGVSDFLDDLRSFSSLNVTAVRAGQP